MPGICHYPEQAVEVFMRSWAEWVYIIHQGVLVEILGLCIARHEDESLNCRHRERRGTVCRLREGKFFSGSRIGRSPQVENDRARRCGF